MFPCQRFFPGYAVPAELLALVDVGSITDESYGNDACPRFHITAEGDVILWVDHPDTEQRECPGKRFTVVYDDPNDACHGEVAISTDSLPELLHYLADHWDIR